MEYSTIKYTKQAGSLDTTGCMLGNSPTCYSKVVQIYNLSPRKMASLWYPGYYQENQALLLTESWNQSHHGKCNTVKRWVVYHLSHKARRSIKISSSSGPAPSGPASPFWQSTQGSLPANTPGCWSRKILFSCLQETEIGESFPGTSDTHIYTEQMSTFSDQ